MTDKKYSDSLDGLRRIQRELLRQFVDFCRREKLSYYALFGTMIGATRHGGFIPWDDDIDVAMPRADYDKLCGMADTFAPPYFLQTPENDPGACPRIVRLMNLNTTYITPEYPSRMLSGGHMGCCIDILPLDEAPGRFASWRMGKKAKKNWRLRYRRAPLEEMTQDEMPDWKRKNCRMLFPKSYGELTRSFYDICTRYAGKKTRFYTIVSTKGGHRVLLMPKRCFDEYIEMDFDDLKIRVPKGHAELADIIYENGSELPDESKRTPKHSGLVDTQNPYTKYTARYKQVFHNLREKKILLFGAGNMLNIYMERYGEKYPPVCTFDNDPKKWGMVIGGIPVKNPIELPGMTGGDTAIIIISLYHREIGKQLEDMGICDYRVYLDGWEYKED